MANMRELFLGSLALAVVACAGSNAASAPERSASDGPQAVDVVKVEPAAEVPDPPSLPVPPRPDDDPETIPLSGAWAATFGHTASYQEAMLNVRSARAAWARASQPLFQSDGGLPEPLQFQNANSLIDLLNRRLAAAYYAPDAAPDDRVRVLEEAASTLLLWSRRLDEVGLAKTPPSYRTDRRVALTFEEVTDGPAKRWRSEGYQLAKLCVERGSSEKLDNATTRSCKTLQDSYRAAFARNAPPPKTAAPAECACNPGDPLCSATMSGWCRPTK